MLFHKITINNNHNKCKMRKTNRINKKMMSSTNITKVPWKLLMKSHTFLMSSKDHNLRLI